MFGGRQRFSRRQVEQAERMAWAEQHGLRYYFDGMYFWMKTEGQTLAAKPEAVPQYGWRHRRHCSCPLCGSQSASMVGEHRRQPDTTTPADESRDSRDTMKSGSQQHLQEDDG